MNIHLMRKTDRWLGVPLVFLLALAYKVRRLFAAPKPEAGPARNILFIQLSEMGSMVLLSPLVHKVRKAHPGAGLYFLTFHYTASGLTLLGMIDEDKILTLRTSGIAVFLRDVIALLCVFRRVRFDITFDLELFSRASALLSSFSGAPVTAGFDNFMAEGLYRGDFLTHPVTYNPHRHISRNFLSLFHALEEPHDSLPHTKQVIPPEEATLPPFSFPEEEVATFRRKLHAAHPSLAKVERLVILNPNSSQLMPLRRWPLTSYLALARRLMERPGLGIVVTGMPEEAADADFICSSLAHDRVKSLVGFTTMRELLALYNIANLLVSNDSGPPQFAALAGIPAIVLFGPETPELYGSLNPGAVHIYKGLQCSPCITAYNNRQSPCRNNVCMQAITVDEVYIKAAEMLA
jgi:ADP-heptose:LPS heptosyltransferase